MPNAVLGPGGGLRGGEGFAACVVGCRSCVRGEFPFEGAAWEAARSARRVGPPPPHRHLSRRWALHRVWIARPTVLCVSPLSRWPACSSPPFCPRDSSNLTADASFVPCGVRLRCPVPLPPPFPVFLRFQLPRGRSSKAKPDPHHPACRCVTLMKLKEQSLNLVRPWILIT